MELISLLGRLQTVRIQDNAQEQIKFKLDIPVGNYMFKVNTLFQCEQVNVYWAKLISALRNYESS